MQRLRLPRCRNRAAQVFTQKDGSAGGEGGNGQKFTQAKDLLKARRRRQLAHAGAAQETRREREKAPNKPWAESRTAATQVYGSAYLVTSISLSIVSFSLSYVLVSAGVDVAGLLEKARRCACSSLRWRRR